MNDASPLLTLLIVDDEAPARLRLRELLADLAGELPNQVLAEAADGLAALAALAALSQQRVDVALVDIRMPTMDGIEFARHSSQLADPPAIIFVTAFDAYAIQAFELNAIDYLLKPVRAPRLLAALRKVGGRRPPAPDVLASLSLGARRHLACHERGRLLLIPLGDVIYFRADLKYVAARTREREYLLDESLNHLEDEFRERFIRLHRSVLAAKEAICGFQRNALDDSDAQWQAILRDIPERLPISRRQWPVVRSLLRAARA
ncbi:MAG TPA: LytTR family DNA-binding domain-containing protein [Accumulibacter sp.]|uniref:LytR/AlgR family response regulator transcription factor n=1 Tax=Accumulibacter sp. TaxID=2053492 RepID=UPI002B775287|nr:LytTR family DNA-binding domain-containing protein [Accumulibacter sp.]HNN82967.1 LytTR family DNA-binding domain-containing protein [Accumulibacter sp.]